MVADDIIKLAREAGFMPTVLNHWPNELQRFARLVAAAEREAMTQRLRTIIVQAEERGAAAEREACAKLCEDADIVLCVLVGAAALVGLIIWRFV